MILNEIAYQQMVVKKLKEVTDTLATKYEELNDESVRITPLSAAAEAVRIELAQGLKKLEEVPEEIREEFKKQEQEREQYALNFIEGQINLPEMTEELIQKLVITEEDIKREAINSLSDLINVVKKANGKEE